MADDDLFESLLAAKWRDVEFPVTRTRLELAHDLVEHKYWGVDGARVESTGLAPIRFTFTSPLLNTITPGRNEKWAALYPNQFRALIAAFQKKEMGDLQHIEFGMIKCKAERLSADWDAARRGGVDVELSFVQSIPAGAEVLLNSTTPVQVVDIGAAELTSEKTKADLTALLKSKGLALPPYLQKNTPDLSESFNKIKAAFDSVTVAGARITGKFDAIEYQVDRIQQSVDQAKSATTWPITQNVERIKEAVHDLHNNLHGTSKTIALFKVPSDTTLAGVIQQLPQAKVSDVIRLNPSLMKSPEVTKGTIVRYYKAA